jgi:hypothetical protein
MRLNNCYQDSAIELVNKLISNINFQPIWFVSIHYLQNRAIYHNSNHSKFRVKNESNSIESTEKNFKHFKNLLLCKTHNVSSANRIKNKKFRMLAFHEQGEANYSYHSHILLEAIPTYSTQDDVDGLLRLVQHKHKGMENWIDGVDVKAVYSNGWIDYVCKTATKDYSPLDLLNSDLK